MTKTFKELRESAVGIVTGVMQPAEIRNLKEFARQVSGALQPSIPEFLKTLEQEVNKYGFSLGELDLVDPFTDTGEEDYILIAHPLGDEVRNVFLSLRWEKASAKIFNYSPNVLQFSVHLTVNEIDPGEFDGLFFEFDGSEVSEEADSEDKKGDKDSAEPVDSDVKEAVEEKNGEPLEEAAPIYKKVNRTFQAKMDGMNFYFTVEPAGSVFFSIQTQETNDKAMQWRVPKAFASAFMTKLMDHYISLAE